MSDTTDEDKLAAEWAAMEQGGAGAAGGADAGGHQARVLNQDEIDSLLGFDADSDRAAETSGIQAIVNSSLVSYEKLPMLEVLHLNAKATRQSKIQCQKQKQVCCKQCIKRRAK